MNRVILMILSILICGLMLSNCGTRQEIVRDKNGNVILKCELQNGVRHGMCYHFYPNGAIKEISNFVAGVREGESIEYFENGTLKARSNYVNGYLIKNEVFNEDGRLQEEYHYVTINNQSRLNGILIYDTDSTCEFPYNVNLNKTLYAEIFADSDTVYYGSFVEFEVGWLCSEEHWVGGIKNNSTFFIDHNFNQSGHSTFAAKRVDVENKNRFYPSNKQSDTLRIIFGFSRVINGNVIDDLDTYLEKVFTVIEK